MEHSGSRLTSTHRHDDGVDAWRTAAVAPPGQLVGLIDGYSDYAERTGSFTTRRELPHAQGVLIVNLAEPLALVGGDGGEIVLQAGQGFVAGAHLRPALSRSQGAQSGIHVFLPLASLRRLVGVPMDRLLDQVVPLDEMLGVKGAFFGHALVEARDLDQRVALLDATLTRRFAATPPLPQAQLHALDLLRNRPELDIAEVARAVGWSRKHLASRVHDAVGVGPRSWRRLIRFERVTRQLVPGARPDWAAVAQSAGYCDQPHLIREFREFAGLTPGDFLARSLPDAGGLVEG